MYHEKIRPDIIDECGPWFWPYADDGAWDGPVQDWKSHKPTIEVLKNRRTAIQAGGCCGLYPKLLSKMFDKVFTFEPDNQNFHFLKKNIGTLPNIYMGNFALGAEEKLVSMNRITETNVGMHMVDDNLVGGQIPMTTVDKYIGDYGDVDLIWFDLEGYEIHALNGARETIAKNRPLIGVERASEQIVNFMNEFGYVHFTNSEMDTFFLPKEFPR